MKRDSVGYTVTVAAVLCIVCSVVVSSAAVLLRPYQEKNKRLDQQTNVLRAAGIDTTTMSNTEIEAMFADENKIRRQLIDLSTGKAVSADEASFDVAIYDPKKAAKSPDLSTIVQGQGGPTPGVTRREKYAFAFQILEDGKVQRYVLPIYGKGLWSTLYGFLALEADTRTVAGITFYEHKETPGLGGEVENPDWQKQWQGKTVMDAQGNVSFQVMKGQAPPDSTNKVDGLSGATITSRGVSNLVQYWVGPDGFGPYLANQRAE